jgi:hypothetical protein
MSTPFDRPALTAAKPTRLWVWFTKKRFILPTGALTFFITSMTDDSMMISRQSYLTLKSRQPSQHAFPVPLCVATEAVATMAIEHPEWDMDEIKTWDQWEKQRHRLVGAGRTSSRTSKVTRRSQT